MGRSVGPNDPNPVQPLPGACLEQFGVVLRSDQTGMGESGVGCRGLRGSPLTLGRRDQGYRPGLLAVAVCSNGRIRNRGMAVFCGDSQPGLIGGLPFCLSSDPFPR